MTLLKPKVVDYRSKAYDYRSFCCGSSDMDRWLAQVAGQSEKRFETRTKLLVSGEPESRDVIGYYALQNFQVAPEQASQVRHKEWKYPLPATLLARLAVSVDHQGKGYGAQLLIDAMRSAGYAAEFSGSAVLVVDAIDGDAKRFYERYSFIPFEDDSKRLFMPMAKITNSLVASHNQ